MVIPFFSLYTRDSNPLSGNHWPIARRASPYPIGRDPDMDRAGILGQPSDELAPV